MRCLSCVDFLIWGRDSHSLHLSRAQFWQHVAWGRRGILRKKKSLQGCIVACSCLQPWQARCYRMQVKLSFTETLRAGLTSLKIAFLEDLKDEDITNLKPLSRLQVLVVNVRLCRNDVYV